MEVIKLESCLDRIYFRTTKQRKDETTTKETSASASLQTNGLLVLQPQTQLSTTTKAPDLIGVESQVKHAWAPRYQKEERRSPATEGWIQVLPHPKGQGFQ